MRYYKNCGWMAFVVAVYCVLGAASAAAASFTFTPLGDLAGGGFTSRANGVSADGSVIVGYSSSGSGPEAFRWTSGGGMIGLGDLAGNSFGSNASGVSADGSVIVGESYSTAGSLGEAFRWTSGGGMVGLGFIAGGGNTHSSAKGVSGDGSVVVGNSTSPSSPAPFGNESFRWTSGGGVVGLGDLPGGAFYGSAQAVSNDGLVAAGQSSAAAGQDSYRWTSGGGMVGLGDLPGGIFMSVARGMSGTGDVVVGFSESASSTAAGEAFRWTSGGGMVGLGDLPGGAFESLAWDAAYNNSTVVGYGTTALGLEAFIWTATDGMMNLQSMLVAKGATGLTGWRLTEATGISDDGLTIVGVGINPLGQTEAWSATVPEPSTALLAGLGGLFALVFCRHRLRAT